TGPILRVADRNLERSSRGPGAELGAFLRGRRDRLSPTQARIEPFPGPRRVPGLRREELAVAAGLSPDYYSRLEQGRQANVSPEVLDALARALRLDDTERAHTCMTWPRPAHGPAVPPRGNSRNGPTPDYCGS
ncbi:helix-turn-helix domain-containing protein, partial [Candidatus Frankia alpina]|uniref:helix-turn-helix domain-containing protein n=1 Tax=Candidatus Frankia alpina TaxID=2699483 RepID=UPI001A98E332